MELVLKTSEVKAFVGSNPTVSAIFFPECSLQITAEGLRKDASLFRLETPMFLGAK